MPKNHMTAEQFEEEIAKLQTRTDRLAKKISEIYMAKATALYEQMDKDQQDRASRRYKARHEEQRPRILRPRGMMNN